jgi:hypothetical protein
MRNNNRFSGREGNLQDDREELAALVGVFTNKTCHGWKSLLVKTLAKVKVYEFN